MATSYAPRNIFGHEKLKKDFVTLTASEVDTDASGDITITFPHLRQIIEDSVDIKLEAGYVANVISVAETQQQSGFIKEIMTRRQMLHWRQ